MITFEPDKEHNNNLDNSEDEIRIAETGDKVEKIVDAADKAAQEKKEAEEKNTNDQNKASKAEEIKEEIKKEISKEFDGDFSINENPTLFHKGNLRNGVSLEYDGSIVLLGDVNAGAQVKARGNLLVLGTIKGTVHAGCLGNREAFIFALNMRPVQLRIGDIITRFPDDMEKTDLHPEYAYVEDGRIYISEF